jgi:hypothetical protein
MSIKQIFEEISSLTGDIVKVNKLAEYADNELLKKVLYLICSKRVKFYIKQIPEYTSDNDQPETLEWALQGLKFLSDRTYTGNRASSWLQILLSSVSNDDAYIIERIIGKDPKLGMGTTFINKVFPGLLEKTPYQGAKPYDKKLVEKIISNGNAVSQLKLDGRYQNAIIRGGDVVLETRQGEVTILTGAKFIDELSNFSDEMVLNGELTIDDIPSRTIANGILNSLNDIFTKMSSRTEKENSKKLDSFIKEHGEINSILNRIRYTVWDAITVEDYFNMESNTPYKERYKALKSIVECGNNTNVSIVDNVPIKTFEEAIRHFSSMLSDDLEGTIIKDFTAKWKNGKPNYQVKLKLEMNLDLRIIGFQYGNKGTKNENVVSTLLVESSCGLLKTNPSGMDEKMMDDITRRQDELLGTIVEIRCCGLSQNSKGEWSTQHPSVIELRSDKNDYDSLESAKLIENGIKGLN